MDTNMSMETFNKGDSVNHEQYGGGTVTRTKCLGFMNCCSVEVTWNDTTKPKRLFHKHELQQLKKV
jgi:hypothetical protein